EIKRVLKKTGTLFWNMNDSYAGNMGWTEKYANKQQWHPTEPIKRDLKFPSKSLMLIPERFAMAMIDDGWILRNKIIWRKLSGMPSSVKDRFSNKWEYVFFFTKNKKYYFDLDAVRKPLAESSKIRANYGWNGREIEGIGRNQPQAIEKMGERWSPSIGANPGDIVETPAVRVKNWASTP
ncbi:MAG: DNA methyltransferase, partial [Thermoplasmata archaeon]